MSADRFAVARTVLAEMPCPVVVIGAGLGAERSCATGTAMYVSFSPPALTVAVHPGSRTCRLIEASGEFSVSLLADDQVEAAIAGGRSAAGLDKFSAAGLAPLASASSGAPAVDGSPLVAWCRVTHRQPVGDHVLFVGEVVDHRETDDAAPPLLRQRRRYVRRGEWLTDDRADGYPT